MRKRTCVALVGLLVTATGCKLTIPAGLGPFTVANSPKPSGDPGVSGGGGDCDERFAKLDRNKDKALTLDEFVPKGSKDDEARRFLDLDANGDRKLSPEEFAATCEAVPATPKPTRTPPVPVTPPPGNTCEDAFAKYDRDRDGHWEIEEFLGWDGSRPRPKMACYDGPMPGGGTVVAAGSGSIVAMGGGNLVGPTRGLAQTKIDIRAGGTVSSDGGGVLIGNDGSALITDQGGGMIIGRPAPAPYPCPPDDPKFRFSQFDHDGDGRISAKEFCEGPIKRPTPMPTPSFGPYPYPTPWATATPGPYGCEDGFFQTDTDGDGLVSREEFKARYVVPDMIYSNGADGRGEWVSAPQIDPSSQFDLKDADRDGYLSLGESCGYNTLPVETPPPDDGCGFFNLDQDNNGEATWEEFHTFTVQSQFPPPAKDVVWTRFSELDFDQNRVITRDEYCYYTTPEPYPYPSTRPATPYPMPTYYPGCKEVYDKADRDRDGYLTFGEWADYKMGMMAWIQAPSDEELAKLRESFGTEAKAHDRNGDGRLHPDEAGPLCGTGSPTTGGGLISNNGGGLATK